MPLRCHFSSWTGWNALTSHGPMSLKIHSESACFCFEVYMIFFVSSWITCAYSSEALLSADKMTPSMKLINVIWGNTACNPLRTASSVTPVDNKYNINSSALFSCHHLSVMVRFYNAVIVILLFQFWIWSSTCDSFTSSYKSFLKRIVDGSSVDELGIETLAVFIKADDIHTQIEQHWACPVWVIEVWHRVWLNSLGLLNFETNKAGAVCHFHQLKCQTLLLEDYISCN